MKKISTYIFHKSILILMSILILFFVASTQYSCKSPLDIDAIRDKDTVFDPNNLPATIKVIPDNIDFGMILPGDSLTKDFIIENLKKNEIIISSIKFKKDNGGFNLVTNNLPFKLNSLAKSNSLKVLFAENNPGYYFDTIVFNDYKKPFLYLKASVPHVFGRDLYLDDTKIGGISGKVLRIYNGGDDTAIVTEFKIIDNNNIFFYESSLNVPFEILPKTYKNIVINFNPSEANIYKSKIKISATTSGIVDEIIELEGNGIK